MSLKDLLVRGVEIAERYSEKIEKKTGVMAHRVDKAASAAKLAGDFLDQPLETVGKAIHETLESFVSGDEKACEELKFRLRAKKKWALAARNYLEGRTAFEDIDLCYGDFMKTIAYLDADLPVDLNVVRSEGLPKNYHPKFEQVGCVVGATAGDVWAEFNRPFFGKSYVKFFSRHIGFHKPGEDFHHLDVYVFSGIGWAVEMHRNLEIEYVIRT